MSWWILLEQELHLNNTELMFHSGATQTTAQEYTLTASITTISILHILINHKFITMETDSYSPPHTGLGEMDYNKICSINNKTEYYDSD